MTTTKQYQLPREFGEKWVKALRSGEYKQGRQKLGNCEIGYCCIGLGGVLCGATDEMYTSSEGVAGYINNNSAYKPSRIPEDVLQRIPKELRGTGYENPLVQQLSTMNDKLGYSFPEIADWIEKNVEFV